MKSLPILLLHVLLILANEVHGQGTIIYDQQSAVENPGEGFFVNIQANTPIGQSFTPTLSSVDFIRLALRDGNIGNGLGATVFLNLRSSSIDGPILGSTEPVLMPDGFAGYPSFLFSTPITVSMGNTYFFDVNIQTGDSWQLLAFSYDYEGGSSVFQGTVFNNQDLWFREGIVAVPEPPTSWLALTGGVTLFFVRRRFRRF